jgi:hypothetical protein
MNFDLNSGFLYLVAGAVILFVLAQSAFFLRRAIVQTRVIGMDRKVIRSTVRSAAVFTVAPALAILLGVLSLSKFLGLPLPWLRLSILGALTYELTAAASAASSFGVSVSDPVRDPVAFTAIVWVMTVGIIPSMVLIPLFLRKLQKGLVNLKNRDQVWGEHLMTALFMGMISAFSGMVFSRITTGLRGWIPVFVLVFSALVMGLCGLAIRKGRAKWLMDYALPISILGGMAFAVVITNLIG